VSNNLAITLTAIGGTLAAIVALYQIFKPLHTKVKRFSDWIEKFMRDWSGEEAEPGRDRVPGVMERLNKLDGELSNNGGKSTKDVVDKLLYNQEKVIEAFQIIIGRLGKIEEHLNIDVEVEVEDPIHTTLGDD
jgi:hypothetical protein